MMIGHLTFAGLAEAVITAGVVAYLQAADPALLLSTSGLAGGESLTLRPASGSLRRLWIAVAALMLLTPWEFLQPERRGANGRRRSWRKLEW